MPNLTPDQETARAAIAALVKKFHNASPSERKNKNESDTRHHYILPLFRALGWDSEDSAQMRAEQNIKGKRVDFSFLINGKPRFLLETKAIGEDLNKSEYIKQARDYAWNKGVTWAVLSDFEGTRVFNAEWKEADPLHAQVLNFSVEEYLKKFEELWLLSRAAMAAGLLDAKAERDFKKTPRTPITESLFGQLIDARKKLYDDFRGFNALLFHQERLVDDAVQRMLDRLIFLRTAEDRAVEHESLRSIVRSAPAGKVSETLAKYLHKLDAVYNSQLFASHPTDAFYCTDDTLTNVIEGLYLTPARDAEYNFAAIDADVLGRVYEQYLGEVISEYAKSEAKKKKRKSQGIYYTPTFVVRYIVEQTLGRYLQENGYNASKPVRVLDPACGSGSFLIEAFDVLDRFVARQEGSARDKHDVRAAMRQRQILEQNLFGVDLDEQAVEVARLNVMLKALYRREKIPMLKHIARGDSLLSGTDAELEKFFGAGWENKHAFNWDERFAEPMHAGGFDVVVGNPPWLMAGYYLENDLSYLREHYESASGKFDLYYLFIELGTRLLKENGYLGMIVPNKFFQTQSAENLRNYLASRSLVETIIDFGEEQLFHGATNYSSILLLRKSSNATILYAKSNKDMSLVESYKLSATTLTRATWNFGEQNLQTIFGTMEKKGQPLSEIVQRFGTGVQSGADKLMMFDSPTARKLELEKELMRSIYRGRDVRRYTLASAPKQLLFPYSEKKNEFVIFTKKEMEKNYPSAFTYLEKNKKHLAKRIWFGKNAKELSGEWYGLMYLDSAPAFKAPHLLTPSLSNRSNFALGDETLFVTGTAGVTSVIFDENLKENILYFLGILNSALLSLYAVNHSTVFQGGYRKFSASYLKKLPIRRINFSIPAEKRAHDHIVALVERMLKLHKDLQATNELDAERRGELLERIARTDGEIDEKVYEVYELSAEERRTLERESR